METQTVKQLREIAKSRGVKYHGLKKADLILALTAPPRQGWFSKIFSAVTTPITTAVTAGLSAIQSVRAGYNKVVNWLSSKPPKQEVDKKLKEFNKTVDKLFNNFEIRETQSALSNATKQYTIDGLPGYDPKTFLDAVKQQVTSLLTQNRQTKIYIKLWCKMERVDMKSSEVITDTVPFAKKTEPILEATDVNEFYEGAAGRILEIMANFQQQGSNWRFKSVVKLEINTFVYRPLKGSSYILLPAELASKKAIINMKNEDNECFKWCVTRALNPKKNHPELITEKLIEQAEQLNWSGIEFPLALESIDKFEGNNTDIGVNVFRYKNRYVEPSRISTQEGCKHVINLLFISKDCGNEKINHYCLIKSLSRLLSSQVSKKEHKRLYCRRCLISFDNEKALQKHKTFCNKHKAVRIELPEPGTTLSFKNYNKSMRVPFVVYADFESFIKPIDTCQPNPDSSYTKQYQKHTPSSFCYHIKCFDNKIYSQEPVAFTAESEDDDVAQIFFDTLEHNIKEIYKKFRFPKRMILTAADNKKFEDATVCYICEKELGDGRVRDHCHLSGKFRGAAHESCNLNYKIPKFFPVFFHNLAGYDSHLFIKKLAGGKINCIPNNEEKYISFSREIVVDKFKTKDGIEREVKRELRFLDSFRFMGASLDALSKNLPKEQFKNIRKRYSKQPWELLLRKGVYPYDYVDCIAKLDETCLPPIDAFYSRLNDSGIDDKDYEHAQTVCKEIGCKTFRDYHNLYNESNVLILADVFENFRDICMKHYKLDPAWYYTAPSLSWDAMLKLTEEELELLSDYDMVLMVKHGIRGGISTISHRYACANNKYMGESYDRSKPSSFIEYLDANNLYGWAMSRKLPTHGFKWMSDSELENWRVIPCILEVDLEYPTELHDLHNDYPLAPESITINKVDKLIPNLNNKQNYIIHRENLKQYVSLGLKITKIHRGIRFEESDWLKKYIDLNTDLRTQATNDFEKDFF